MGVLRVMTHISDGFVPRTECTERHKEQMNSPDREKAPNMIIKLMIIN